MHADVAIDIGPLLGARDERLGDFDIPTVGPRAGDDDRTAGELAVVHDRGVRTHVMPLSLRTFVR